MLQGLSNGQIFAAKQDHQEGIFRAVSKFHEVFVKSHLLKSDLAIEVNGILAAGHHLKDDLVQFSDFPGGLNEALEEPIADAASAILWLHIHLDEAGAMSAVLGGVTREAADADELIVVKCTEDKCLIAIGFDLRFHPELGQGGLFSIIRTKMVRKISETFES